MEIEYKYTGEKSVTLKNKAVTIKLTSGDLFSVNCSDVKCVVTIADYTFLLSTDSVSRLIKSSSPFVKESKENETFEQKLERIINVASDIMVELHQESYDSLPYKVKLAFEMGQKFARIVKFDEYEDGKTGGRSAWAFVDRETERLWKPAGWKAPARNFSRGSLEDLQNKQFVKSHMYGF